MSDTELLRAARRRAAAKLGFLIHLAVFVAVNLLLLAINRGLAPDTAWHLFPLGGWAIGLGIHGLAVFLAGSGFREQMIERELRTLRSRRALHKAD